MIIPKESETYKEIANNLSPDLRGDPNKEAHWISCFGNHIQSSDYLTSMMGYENSKRDIVRAACEAAQLGLVLGQTAYIIPMNVKQIAAGTATCRLQKDYRGLLQIWRSDRESTVQMPETVYEKDVFYIKKGTEGKKPAILHHEPCVRGLPGKAIGYYLIWTHRGVMDFVYRTEEQMMEYIRDNVANRSGRVPHVWESHPVAMRLKTLINIAFRWGNVTQRGMAIAEVVEKYHHEDEILDEEVPQEANASTKTGSIIPDTGGGGQTPLPTQAPQEVATNGGVQNSSPPGQTPGHTPPAVQEQQVPQQTTPPSYQQQEAPPPQTGTAPTDITEGGSL